MNAHADCINMVQPTMCPSLAPKKSGGIPLLRRQKPAAPPTDETPSGEHSELHNFSSKKSYVLTYNHPSFLPNLLRGETLLKSTKSSIKKRT